VFKPGNAKKGHAEGTSRVSVPAGDSDNNFGAVVSDIASLIKHVQANIQPIAAKIVLE